MNFEHTEDRRMLADSLGRFLREQYTFEVRDRIARSPEGFSAAHWQQIAGLGAIGALFGEADGGYGGEGFDIAVVFEQLGRALAVEPFLGTLIVGRAIAAAGSEAQCARLADIVEGSCIAALAHGGDVGGDLRYRRHVGGDTGHGRDGGHVGRNRRDVRHARHVGGHARHRRHGREVGRNSRNSGNGRDVGCDGSRDVRAHRSAGLARRSQRSSPRSVLGRRPGTRRRRARGRDGRGRLARGGRQRSGPARRVRPPVRGS